MHRLAQMKKARVKASIRFVLVHFIPRASLIVTFSFIVNSNPSIHNHPHKSYNHSSLITSKLLLPDLSLPSHTPQHPAHLPLPNPQSTHSKTTVLSNKQNKDYRHRWTLFPKIPTRISKTRSLLLSSADHRIPMPAPAAPSALVAC